MRKLFTFTLLAISAISPVALNAQISLKRLQTTLATAPPTAGTTPETAAPECDYFFNTPYTSGAKLTQKQTSDLSTCATSLESRIPGTGKGTAAEMSAALKALSDKKLNPADLQKVLLDTRDTSTLLAEWAGCTTGSSTDPSPPWSPCTRAPLT